MRSLSVVEVSRMVSGGSSNPEFYDCFCYGSSLKPNAVISRQERPDKAGCQDNCTALGYRDSQLIPADRGFKLPVMSRDNVF